MFDAKRITGYLVVLIVIFIFIIVYMFTYKNDGNDRKEIETDHTVAQNNLNISQNKNLEIQDEEKKLIETVNSWERGKPEYETAEAIKKLGEMKSEAAIPALIKQIDFHYMPPERDKNAETRASTPAKDKFLAVFAMAEIGHKAFPGILNRIRQLDSEKGTDLNILFHLGQAVSHMADLSTSEAITILPKEAEKTENKKGKNSLLYTASLISAFKKDISEMSEHELINVVKYGAPVPTIVRYPGKYKAVFEAIKKLGEMKSEAAVSILVENVYFGYCPKIHYEVFLSSQGVLGPMKERECTVYALRNIGRKAVPHIIESISEIDPKIDLPVSKRAQVSPKIKLELSRLSHLEDALAGMKDISKEEVINILKQKAEKADDKKVKERLLLAASKVKHVYVFE